MYDSVSDSTKFSIRNPVIKVTSELFSAFMEV